MRYLVLSDIHANLEALEATLATAGACDLTLVLGDLVGYGADPNAVIERVRRLEPVVVIRGNHDKVAAGLEGVEGFNQIAREAIEWTATALTPENSAWLPAEMREVYDNPSKAQAGRITGEASYANYRRLEVRKKEGQ